MKPQPRLAPTRQLAAQKFGAAIFALLLCFLLIPRAEAARSRPVINAAGTTFVADNGRLLRGAIVSTETGNVPLLADVQAIKNYGLNSIHCYAERPDYGYSAGAKFAALDSVVQMTRDNGLYLVITVGGGGVNAAFNSAFWTFYAPRYANETHVIYEIQNEPGYGAPVSASVITLQQTAYTTIRAAAPNTPILFFSYMIFQNGAGVLTDIAALGSGIDWSKAAIGFHGYGEKGPAGTRACLETVLDAGYACVQTEFYRWPWGTGNFNLVDAPSLYTDIDETGDFERLGVSWLTFLPLARVAEDARFKTQLNAAGIVWTPDFGTWPSGSRATYGNAGEPRPIARTATTRIQAEDFDTGGQGIGYSDTTTTNSGGAYRGSEGVDIESTSDTGGGYNVGWVAPGEWLEYTIKVNDPGLYTLQARVASLQATNNLRVLIGGVDVTGTWTFASTGGLQTWTTITKSVNLVPGQQKVRIEPLTSGFKINWVELVPASTGLVTNGTYKILNRNGSKAMDVINASTANGAKLQQWSYSATSNQQWVLTHRGANQYTITSAQTGKCIDQASSTALSGDYLAMWPLSGTSGGPNQRWLVTPTDSGCYQIVSVNAGLVFEIVGASTANGARVEQREYTGGTHQQWLIAAP